ncbi:MAG: FkbM family methyltransferase [Acidobacteriota bacterium]
MLKLIRALTILIAVCTILGIAAILALASPTGKARVVAAFGSCPFDQILEGEKIVGRFQQVQTAVQERSHRVREDGNFQLWSTPQGEFWYLGAMGRQDFFVLAEEEFDIYKTDRIKPGAIVLDCGANYGTFTRRALNRGAAKVVAIEINPDLQEALRRTFAKEIREGKVVVYGKGVWNQETELVLRGDSVVLDKQGPPERLPVTTIDHIVSELQLSSVDFIKMDIEGAEKNVLRGGQATLEKFSPIMALSAEHLPDDSVSIPALVSKLIPGRYNMKFGFCEFDRPFHAAPNVLHFSN